MEMQLWLWLLIVWTGLLFCAKASLCPGPDASGYRCSDIPMNAQLDLPSPIDISNDLLAADTTTVPIGFPFTFYGATYVTTTISSNGFLTFDGAIEDGGAIITSIPSQEVTNAIFGFWTNLCLACDGLVKLQYSSTEFIVSFESVGLFEGDGTVSFQIKLLRSGEIEVHVAGAETASQSKGVVGIDNIDGSIGLQHYYGSGKVAPFAVRFETDQMFTLGLAATTACVGTYGPWTRCTKTCGGGIQTRVYRVTKAGTPCPTTLQRQSCNTAPCGKIGSTGGTTTTGTKTTCSGSYSGWSPCSKSCGGGTQHQTFKITKAGTNCPPSIKTQYCNTQPCGPAKCEGTYGNWSQCSVSCGGGARGRAFKITSHGTGCPPTIFCEACNTQECPVPCQGKWGPWSPCSATCGTGVRSRAFKITRNGTNCPPTLDCEVCNTQCCPALCVGTWGPWSPCTKSCGAGTRQQTFTITKPGCPVTNCHATVRSESCNTQKCPVICAGEWGSWEACSRSCGGGTQRQVFKITRQGINCPPTVRTRVCNTQTCPGKCIGEWSAWSSCSKSCGGGTRQRTFKITKTGLGCPPTLQTETCNTASCQVPCEGQYGPWSPCTATCGGGTQQQIFTITRQGFGCPPTVKTQTCNTQPCCPTCPCTTCPPKIVVKSVVRVEQGFQCQVCQQSAIQVTTAVQINLYGGVDQCSTPYQVPPPTGSSPCQQHVLPIQNVQNPACRIRQPAPVCVQGGSCTDYVQTGNCYSIDARATDSWCAANCFAPGTSNYHPACDPLSPPQDRVCDCFPNVLPWDCRITNSVRSPGGVQITICCTGQNVPTWTRVRLFANSACETVYPYIVTPVGQECATTTLSWSQVSQSSCRSQRQLSVCCDTKDRDLGNNCYTAPDVCAPISCSSGGTCAINANSQLPACQCPGSCTTTDATVQVSTSAQINQRYNQYSVCSTCPVQQASASVQASFLASIQTSSVFTTSIRASAFVNVQDWTGTPVCCGCTSSTAHHQRIFHAQQVNQPTVVRVTSFGPNAAKAVVTVARFADAETELNRTFPIPDNQNPVSDVIRIERFDSNDKPVDQGTLTFNAEGVCVPAVTVLRYPFDATEPVDITTEGGSVRQCIGCGACSFTVSALFSGDFLFVQSTAPLCWRAIPHAWVNGTGLAPCDGTGACPSTDANFATVEQCQELCNTTDRCVAIAYGPECILKDVTRSQGLNNFIENPSVPYTWYDHVPCEEQCWAFNARTSLFDHDLAPCAGNGACPKTNPAYDTVGKCEDLCAKTANCKAIQYGPECILKTGSSTDFPNYLEVSQDYDLYDFLACLPINCEVSNWTDWGPCNASCALIDAPPMENRTRTIATPPQNGGQPCTMSLFEARPCPGNEANITCTVDCEVSEWSAWSPCTTSCDFGQQNRSRTILREPQNGGQACPTELEEFAICNTQPCISGNISNTTGNVTVNPSDTCWFTYNDTSVIDFTFAIPPCSGNGTCSALDPNFATPELCQAACVNTPGCLSVEWSVESGCVTFNVLLIEVPDALNVDAPGYNSYEKIPCSQQP